MANKSFCDYCGIEIEFNQNTHFAINGNTQIACDRCYKEYNKIMEKVDKEWLRLKEKMIEEIKGISNKSDKKGFFERLFR
jgi:hypothetical protein